MSDICQLQIIKFPELVSILPKIPYIAELGRMHVRVNFQGVPEMAQLHVISQMCFPNNVCLFLNKN